MALTPYPSLATLPEVVANGGKVPARSVDAFSARTVYASTVVTPDCNLFTGLTPSSGTPTDNAGVLNAVLAQATVNKPVHLVLDGGFAIGSALLIPPTGHVTISGHGKTTGLYILPGSNCHGITNTAGTDLASNQTWNPGIGATAQVGENVTLSNFRLNCNRGTFPNGNCNGGIDGTFTSGTRTQTDPRGPYAGSWWLCGLFFVGLDNLLLDNVWIYDAPTYAGNFYACTHVRASGCRVEAGTPSFSGNTDGWHFNGGCVHLWVADSYFATGDDGVALNVSEGNGQPGGHLFIDNCEFDGCQSAVRVYGAAVATSQVIATNIRGACRYFGFQLGDSGTATSGQDTNHSVVLDNWSVSLTTSAYGSNLFWINADAGDIAITNFRAVEPTIAGAVVTIGSGSAAPAIGSLTLDATVHRNDSGSVAMNALNVAAGSVATLDLSYRCRDLAGSSYAAVSDLIAFTGGSIGRLWLADVDPSHVSALTNSPGSIAIVAGPGMTAGGFGPLKVQVSFEGDSLTNGVNASSGQGTTTGTVYPAGVMAHLLKSVPNFTATNLGVSGRRLDQMLSTRDYAATFDATADLNLIVILGGTNDINQGANSATTYARLLALVADARSLGYVAVVLTVLPSGVSGGFNAVRDSVNASIRSGASSNGYVVADVAGDSRIGMDGDQTNATYYSASDQTHLTDAGYAILASYATRPLLQLVGA